jgi:hypothetical protein
LPALIAPFMRVDDDPVRDIEAAALAERLGGKERSNSRGITSGGMPGPLSMISKTTLSTSRRVRIVRSPCPSVVSTALSTVLVHS